MEEECGGTDGYQIEGNLGNQRQNQKSLEIFFAIRGVVKSFYNLESKNGKSQTSDICHPVVARDNGGPHMIQQHEKHGQQA
jgi:hypothetical protein